MEINLITAICGGMGTLVGFLITLATFMRNRDKELQTKASEQATINTKLDSVCDGVDSLRVDMKTITERLTRMEESTKEAHRRIDGKDG